MREMKSVQRLTRQLNAKVKEDLAAKHDEQDAIRDI